MRTYTSAGRYAALCLIPALAAWTYASSLALRPESRLWVSGSSTARDWKCNADSVIAKIEAAPNAVNAVLANRKVVSSAQLIVPVATLNCGNGTMDEHMRKALKASQFSQISFRVTSYETVRSDSGIVGSAKGELTLGGITKPIAVTGETQRENDGSLRIAGVYQINMKDYGLTPPSLFMGTMKVKENVQVHYDLLLKESGAIVAAAPAAR